jgi:hypothetical protein
MLKRTKEDLGKALGCVVYDALILLVALSVFRKRGQYPVIQGLTWGEPQLANDVILLKCRSLMDFLSPKRRSRDDIVITDFGRPPITLSRDLQSFRRSVNQWTAHLSWQRALRLPAGTPQPMQGDIETRGLSVLTKVRAVVSECVSAGMSFVEERHRRFHDVFEREYTRMTARSVPPAPTIPT